MINLFGEEDNLVKKSRKKYITMQESFGLKEGFKCKNCKHFVINHLNNKKYFKCALWYISNSEATDIRANATACTKYEEEANGKI